MPQVLKTSWWGKRDLNSPISWKATDTCTCTKTTLGGGSVQSKTSSRKSSYEYEPRKQGAQNHSFKQKIKVHSPKHSAFIQPMMSPNKALLIGRQSCTAENCFPPHTKANWASSSKFRLATQHRWANLCKQSRSSEKVQNSSLLKLVPLLTYNEYSCSLHIFNTATKSQMKLSPCCTKIHNVSTASKKG
jgi:hypothetical protein